MTLLHAKLSIEHHVAFYLQMACKHDLLASFSCLDRMPIYLRWMLELLGCLEGVDACMVHVVMVESSLTHLRMGTLNTQDEGRLFLCSLVGSFSRSHLEDISHNFLEDVLYHKIHLL